MTASPSGLSSPDAARGLRQRAVADARRALVLDAARSAFLELGLEGASLREIARRAGYTPGALYSYFASKEEVYGALLEESLERLNAAVGAAVQAAPDAAPATRTRAAATGFFDFYRANPRDLDLGFYLFRGLQARGLTPALDDALNARLLDALAPVGEALSEGGLDAAQAPSEIAALFAHAVGLLLLSHTGRIRLFRQDPGVLFGHYLDALVQRCLPAEAGARAAAAGGSRA